MALLISGALLRNCASPGLAVDLPYKVVTAPSACCRLAEVKLAMSVNMATQRRRDTVKLQVCAAGD